jgi:hypothetical protein
VQLHAVRACADGRATISQYFVDSHVAGLVVSFHKHAREWPDPDDLPSGKCKIRYRPCPANAALPKD